MNKLFMAFLIFLICYFILKPDPIMVLLVMAFTIFWGLKAGDVE